MQEFRKTIEFNKLYISQKIFFQIMSPLEPNMRATYETTMTPEQNLCYLSRILEKLGNLGKKTQDMFSIERGNI